MELEKFLLKLQSERYNDSDAGLQNSAKGERYLQQSYEGRYLFELIQNGRDANKLADINGDIIIEVFEDKMVIANTGQPFDERGIESVTLIGNSTKGTQGFIGFKGIGFKSIVEISDNPSIITQYGTIEFNRKKTKKLLVQSNLSTDQVPLFFIPHYKEQTLSAEQLKLNVVTEIELPFKGKINTSNIRNSFNKIGVEQIVLLGYLNTVKFIDGDFTSSFKIKEDQKKGIITVDKNGEFHKFRHFVTSQISIPPSIIEILDGDEKKMFEREPFIDISLVFEVNDTNRFSEIERSKLYLFYPTEITSGFGFIIHSYFIVNPERKALRDSPLNQFILEKIADFISKEWLKKVRIDFKSSYLDLLVFTRNKDYPILETLYNKLVENLKELKFIYDNLSRKFYKIDEVIIADGFDKGLFPEHELNGKRLIYIGIKKTRDWLLAEFEIEYLTFECIAECIENECIRQRKTKNYKYFENLYSYLSSHKELDLNGRKILLTSTNTLLSNQDDVYYGYKEKFSLPKSITKKIHFLHSNIKLSDSRKLNIGFTEFNSDLLVRGLLKLFAEKSVPNIEILKVLLSLKISNTLFSDIKETILLPVNSETKWVNPLLKPVYINNDDLRAIYSEDNFINYELLSDLEIDIEELNNKLIEFGAWHIPAIYYDSEKHFVKRDDDRFQKFLKIEGFNTFEFEVNGDWKIHSPIHLTSWFTNSIVNNWSFYKEIIYSTRKTPIKYCTSRSDYRYLNKENTLRTSSFLNFLITEKWVKSEVSDEQFAINELIGIGQIEFNQATSYNLKKYLTLLPIDFIYHKQFINFVGLIHLDSTEIGDFKKLLQFVSSRYQNITSYSKEFENFYNKILGKLYDMYSHDNFQKPQIEALIDFPFLGFNEFTESFSFLAAKEIFYIEDKAGYNLLPEELKQEIQPHFTNRDRNRFGKIAKRIGIDYRNEIIQKVENAEVFEVKTFTVWLNDYAPLLALTEQFLEADISGSFSILKKTKVKFCKSFENVIYRNGEVLLVQNNVPFALQNIDGFEIYINNSILIEQKSSSSGIFYNILTDVLGRDISKIRVQLEDYFNSKSKSNFLGKYDVSEYRIKEIQEKFDDFILSKVQEFWIPIIQILGEQNYLKYFDGESIDLSKIALLGHYEFKHLESIIDRITFEHISADSNIQALTELFLNCNIDVETYNEKSNLKIDFRDFYNKKLESLHVKFKPFFSQYLHDSLITKNIEEKSKFQDLIDEYSNSDHFKIDYYILKIDFNEVFSEYLINNYADLKLKKTVIKMVDEIYYDKIYMSNLSSFHDKIKDDQILLDDFLEINFNRSLMYFENTIEELVNRFILFTGSATGNTSAENSAVLNLDKYKNSSSLSISSSHTNSVTTKSHGNFSHQLYGRRVDGSKNNEVNNLIGIVAEKSVYDALSIEFKNVEWVSKNAAKALVNPEGSDIYGYDIHYFDEENNIQYVEVKGKGNQDKHFFISYSEYHFALEKKENYQIIQVFNTLDNDKREIQDIGNIFLIGEDEEVFDNEKFTALFTNLEIRYQ